MITKKSKNLDFQKIDTFELINMETCPITGLAITCKDSWKNIVLTSDYEVSFAIIGSNILLSIPKGDAGTKGKIRFIEARNLVLKEQGLWDKPHIEIKDYKRVNALVSSEARQQFTSHMVSEHLRGHLQAFYGFNAKFAFQFMLRIGQFIFPNIHHIPMEMVKDYHQAISRVFKLMKMTDSFNQNRPPSIEYKDDIYQVSFKLLDDDIIYNEASGTLLDTHIDIFFKYFSQFLQENNLQGKEYYRIVNWQGLTYSSWKAKKDYINQLNKRPGPFNMETLSS